MEIKYQQHSNRKKMALSFWFRVASLYNDGVSAGEIAKRFTNPRTEKHYTRQHIYLILRKLRQGVQK